MGLKVLKPKKERELTEMPFENEMFNEPLENVVKRPVYGFAFDLRKVHIHVFDGENFYIIERNEKGGLTIRKDEGC